MTGEARRPRLVALATAEARDLGRGDLPSEVRSEARVAQSWTWSFVGAVGRVLDRWPAADPETTGLILVDHRGPAEAMATVQDQRHRGRISPYTFIGAFVSTPTGVACISRNLRGPTLNLTMPVDRGGRVGFELARAWVEGESVEHVVLGSTSTDGGEATSRCVLVASPSGEDGSPLTPEKLVDRLREPTGGGEP